MHLEVTAMKPSIAVVLTFSLPLFFNTIFAVDYSKPIDYTQWSKPHRLFPDFSITWTMISSPSVPCSNTAGACAPIGDWFYQICGKDASSVVYPNIQRFGYPAWSILPASHPGGGVYSHSAAFMNGKVVVSGGNTSPGNYYDYTSVYNLGTNTWTQSTLMPQAHMINTAMVSNDSNTCWLLGGEIGDSGTVLNTLYKWSPDDATMQMMAPMPAPRKNAAAAYFPGYIYVFGGAQSGNTGTNTIWRYDCNADNWTVLPVQLVHARTGAAAVQMIYTDILIIGGQNGSTYLSSVEKYRPEDNTIKDVAPMLFFSAGMAAGGEAQGITNDLEYGGYIYVSGGFNGSVVTQANRASVGNGAVKASSLGNIKALFR
jgi:hypothetical protein